MLAFFVLQPYSKGLKKPDDLFLLDDEQPDRPEPMEAERMKELFGKWDKQVIDGE